MLLGDINFQHSLHQAKTLAHLASGPFEGLRRRPGPAQAPLPREWERMVRHSYFSGAPRQGGLPGPAPWSARSGLVWRC